MKSASTSRKNGWLNYFSQLLLYMPLRILTVVDPAIRGVAPQLQSAKQLRVCSHNDSGQAHRDRTHTHGELKSPANEKTSGDRDSDKVIGRSPNEVLDHFSVGSAGKFDRTHDIARIATHEDDSGGLNRYVGSRTYCDSYICSRQCWCVIH